MYDNVFSTQLDIKSIVENLESAVIPCNLTENPNFLDRNHNAKTQLIGIFNDIANKAKSLCEVLIEEHPDEKEDVIIQPVLSRTEQIIRCCNLTETYNNNLYKNLLGIPFNKTAIMEKLGVTPSTSEKKNFTVYGLENPFISVLSLVTGTASKVIETDCYGYLLYLKDRYDYELNLEGFIYTLFYSDKLYLLKDFIYYMTKCTCPSVNSLISVLLSRGAKTDYVMCKSIDLNNYTFYYTNYEKDTVVSEINLDKSTIYENISIDICEQIYLIVWFRNAYYKIMSSIYKSRVSKCPGMLSNWTTSELVYINKIEDFKDVKYPTINLVGRCGISILAKPVSYT